MPRAPSASDRAFGTSAEYSSIENPGGSFSASSRGSPWSVRLPMSSRTAGPVVADGRSGLSGVADARSRGGADAVGGGLAGSGGAAGGSAGRAAGASAWTGAGAGFFGSAKPALAASAAPASSEIGRTRRGHEVMAGRLTQRPEPCDAASRRPARGGRGHGRYGTRAAAQARYPAPD